MTQNNTELQPIEFVDTQDKMTSLQIAEITGKTHAHIMRDIRNMEPAWEKVNQSKFGLVEYKDQKGELRPCYELSKTECLYIATKFNDEARAKLILRWEQLEKEKRMLSTPSYEISDPIERAYKWAEEERTRRALLLENKEKQLMINEQNRQIADMGDKIIELKKKTDYLDMILENKSTVVISQIAQDYGMSAKKFNKVLAENRIQHKINGQWILYSPYNSEGYVQSKSLNITHNNGTVMVKMLTEWTQRGRIFLYQTLKSKGILPLIEQSA
jgi:phage antirepressor YoqD-like protein